MKGSRESINDGEDHHQINNLNHKLIMIMKTFKSLTMHCMCARYIHTYILLNCPLVRWSNIGPSRKCTIVLEHPVVCVEPSDPRAFADGDNWPDVGQILEENQELKSNIEDFNWDAQRGGGCRRLLSWTLS